MAPDKLPSHLKGDLCRMVPETVERMASATWWDIGVATRRCKSRITKGHR